MKVCLVSLTLLATALCQASVGRPSARLILLPARLDLEDSPQPTGQQSNTTNSSQTDKPQSERLVESGEYYVLLEDGRLQMVKYTTAALTKAEETDNETTKAKYQQSQQSQQKNQYQQPQRYQKSQQYQQPQAYQQPQQYQQSQEYQQSQQSQQKNQYQQPQRYQKSQQYQRPQEYQQSQQYQQPQEYQQSQQYQQPQPYQQPQYQTAQNAYYISTFSGFPQQNAKLQVESPQVELVQFPLPGSQFTQTKLQYTEAESEAAEATDAESGYQATVQYREVKPISAPIYAYNPAPLVRIVRNL